MRLCSITIVGEIARPPFYIEHLGLVGHLPFTNKIHFSLTLKRIGFFCFPIKHSTHTHDVGKGRRERRAKRKQKMDMIEWERSPSHQRHLDGDSVQCIVQKFYRTPTGLEHRRPASP